MLIVALAFGQVGAGFFHDKHDAHEAVSDLDRTVLVEHGEHCKVCSIDWVHQFLVSNFDVGSVEQHHIAFIPAAEYSIQSFEQSLRRDRAPPMI